MAESRSSANTSDRIASLEAGYKALGREISGIRDDFSTFASEMRRELHGISNDRKPPWTAIIGACTFVVVLLGSLVTLGASGPIRELDRHEETLSAMSANRFTQQDAIRFDEALQREMRDLDRVSEARINALDRVLQREIALVMDPVKARLNLLESRVTAHQGDGHPESVVEALKGIEKRLQMIEQRTK